MSFDNNNHKTMHGDTSHSPFASHFRITEDGKEELEEDDMRWKKRTHECRSIGLGLFMEDRFESADDAEVKEALISNEEIHVEFVLPDCSKFSGWFKMGQTVEVLKAEVASRFGVEMSEVALFMDARPMLDPLSISDHVSTADQTLIVEVFVETSFAVSRHMHK